MTDFDPPLRLHLDGNALIANWSYLQAQGNAACGAAVKADGYGLGAREVVTRLRDAGCRDFFVAHWAEAEAIADLVPPHWISVLNGLDAADIPAIRKLGAIPVLNTPQQLARWKQSAGGTCHVMFDSGINRLGIGPEQFSSEMFDGLNVDIAMSHLASADEDSPQNRQQLVRFCEQSSVVQSRRKSLANSAGIMLGPDYHFDLTRPGLALYGGVARPELADTIAPVIRISAKILQIRRIGAGETVGYNATFLCKTPIPTATVSIGYADGYFRGFSGRGSGVANGVKLPVLGRVSMDLVTLDISAAPHLAEGDWVDMSLDLPDASRVSGMSQYELLVLLGSRYHRHWQ